jgi:hypothetical protein
MTIFLSRLFDSFSRRLFDYSTLFPTVTVKYLALYVYITIIVPLNTLTRYAYISCVQTFKIIVNVMVGGHVKA